MCASRNLRLVEPVLAEDILCLQIAFDAIEKAKSPIAAIEKYKVHATEIVMASVIDAIRQGKTPHDIERMVVSMAVKYEECQQS